MLQRPLGCFSSASLSSRQRIFNSLSGKKHQCIHTHLADRALFERFLALRLHRVVVVDTPGLGGHEEKIQHAAALRLASGQDESSWVVFICPMSTRPEPQANDRWQSLLEGVTMKNDWFQPKQMDRDSAGFIFYHHAVDTEWLYSGMITAAKRGAPMKHSFTDFGFAWHFDTSRKLTTEERTQVDLLIGQFAALCTKVEEDVKQIDWSKSEWQGTAKGVFLSDLLLKLSEIAEEKAATFTDMFKHEDVGPDIFALYLNVKKELATPLDSWLACSENESKATTLDPKKHHCVHTQFADLAQYEEDQAVRLGI